MEVRDIDFGRYGRKRAGKKICGVWEQDWEGRGRGGTRIRNEVLGVTGVIC